MLGSGSFIGEGFVYRAHEHTSIVHLHSGHALLLQGPRTVCLHFGFLRTGPGPGPGAGDVVTIFGTLNAFNVDNGGSFSVDLRFLADISIVAPDVDISIDAAGCSATAGLVLGASLQLVFSTPGPDHFVGPVPVRVTYITANAIDP